METFSFSKMIKSGEGFIYVMDRAKAEETLNSLLKFEETENVAAGYDKVASDYDLISATLCWRGPDQTAKKLQQVEPNKNARVLDVGCGTGMVGSSMWAGGYRNLYGVDISKKSLAVAREKGVYVKLICASFGPESPLNIENGFFDVVVSTGCFVPNHLDESHVPEMIRLVKQGGFIIIVTRKREFEDEERGMKLKTGLFHLTARNILKRISHEDIPYNDVNKGVALCYQVV